jgi:hypothetical protein
MLGSPWVRNHEDLNSVLPKASPHPQQQHRVAGDPASAERSEKRRKNAFVFVAPRIALRSGLHPSNAKGAFGLMKGMNNLRDVQRRISLIHAGRAREFPVNSLFLNEICRLLAEFYDFCFEFGKFAVIYPVLIVFGEWRDLEVLDLLPDSPESVRSLPDSFGEETGAGRRLQP